MPSEGVPPGKDRFSSTFLKVRENDVPSFSRPLKKLIEKLWLSRHGTQSDIMYSECVAGFHDQSITSFSRSIVPSFFRTSKNQGTTKHLFWKILRYVSRLCMWRGSRLLLYFDGKTKKPNLCPIAFYWSTSTRCRAYRESKCGRCHRCRQGSWGKAPRNGCSHHPTQTGVGSVFNLRSSRENWSCSCENWSQAGERMWQHHPDHSKEKRDEQHEKCRVQCWNKFSSALRI